MNYKDQYEDEAASFEADFTLTDGPQSEMDLYVSSAEYMDQSVYQIFQNEPDVEKRIQQINELRRTGYLANSSFYPEVFEMSLNRTSVPQMLKDYKELIKLNKHFFTRNGLKLVVNPDSYLVETKSGETLLEYPNFLPDQVLNHQGIFEDNQVDFHFIAGYLLSAEIFKVIQLGLTILATEETLSKVQAA